MDWDIPVPFLVSVIFGNIMKIISSDDNGPLHFGGDDNTLENFASDGDIAGEGALFVDVLGLDGFLGGSEAESNVFVVSDARGGFFGKKFFGVEENVFLFLEGPFVLRIKKDVLGYQPWFTTNNYYY